MACHGHSFFVYERTGVFDMVERKKDKDPTFKAGWQAKAKVAVINKAKKDSRDAAAETKAAGRKREAALETPQTRYRGGAGKEAPRARIASFRPLGARWLRQRACLSQSGARKFSRWLTELWHANVERRHWRAGRAGIVCATLRHCHLRSAP